MVSKDPKLKEYNGKECHVLSASRLLFDEILIYVRFIDNTEGHVFLDELEFQDKGTKPMTQDPKRPGEGDDDLDRYEVFDDDEFLDERSSFDDGEEDEDNEGEAEVDENWDDDDDDDDIASDDDDDVGGLTVEGIVDNS